MNDTQFAALVQRVNDLRVAMIRNETPETAAAFFKARDRLNQELERRQRESQRQDEQQRKESK